MLDAASLAAKIKAEVKAEIERGIRPRPGSGACWGGSGVGGLCEK